jgi:protein SCO1/2
MHRTFKNCLPIFLGAFVMAAVGIVSRFCPAQTTEDDLQNIPAQADNDPLGLREVPAEGQDIGVDDKIGEVLKMSVPFRDDQNNFLRINDLFDGKRPVMLSFNYSNCPKLCSVQLENMTLALREVDFTVGKDFQVVSISIDPNEQTSRARASKEKYVKLYNQPESADSWRFLTGKRDDIAAIAGQCGFRYKYVREQKLYSHPPVFILISPQGKIVRYIHGLDYDPDTIELALIEAAEGKIGSPINILSYGLGCFSFNEMTGKYTLQAMAIMRISGALTAVALLLGLVPYWFFRRDKTEKNEVKPREEPLAGTAV